MKLAWSLLAASSLLVSCGASLYAPLSSSDSPEAMKEDAIIALDRDDFAAAEAKLSKIWTSNRSNDVAQLYAVSLLGQGGFTLFDIIKNAVVLAVKKEGESEEGKTGGTDIMNELATNSSEILGGEVTPERQTYALRALAVLGAADDQGSSGLRFQKCVTAGIYAVPILDAVTSMQNKLTEIQRVQAASDVCGNAAVAKKLEDDISLLIDDASAVSESVSTIGDVLGTCLPKEQGAQVNEITKRVQGILSAADKGCDIDLGGVQTIGNIPLPVCLNDALVATENAAQAGDGKVSGCELFLHCGGGTCF